MDLAVQNPPDRAAWRRRRWILFLAGTLLAMLITQYWIGDEIYPDVLRTLS